MVMMAALLSDSSERVDRDLRASSFGPTVWEMESSTGGNELAAYAAISSQPENRPANTADTYELFADSNQIVPGATALLLTSAIYVPYQHLDAALVLGRAYLVIETVGLLSSSSRQHPPHAFRQEIRSALRSAAVSVAA